jgi:hypothetical protein
MESEEWFPYFNGTGASEGVDIDAFAQLADGSLLFSLTMDSNLGVLGPVDDSDILRFVPAPEDAAAAGTLEWYFDASDVELARNDEDIDALAMLDDGRLVISTQGAFEVAGVSGSGEDLVAFTPSRLGQTTEGTWSRYFDGSDVGLSHTGHENITALWVDADNGDIYLATNSNFTVVGASGSSSDILVCSPTSLGETTRCAFHVYWRGQDNGFEREEIDTMHIRRVTGSQTRP